MSSDSSAVPPVPPPPPLPPQPPQYPPAPGSEQPTKLPLVSLIFGLVALVQCIPVIAGVVAIVTGVMGRKKARQQGAPTGMATAGIWLGVIGIVITIIWVIVLLAGGLALFGVAKQQTGIAEQLKPAQVAAESYGAANGTYAGLTLSELEQFGYIPNPDYTVEPFSVANGNSYCIQGFQNTDPGTIIHVPVLPGETEITITMGGASYRYSPGACPAS